MISLLKFHVLPLIWFLLTLSLVAADSSPYLPNLTVSPIVAGVALLAGGFLFLFFGIRLFKPILFLTGLAFGSLLGYTILLNLKNNVDFGPNQDLIFLLAPLGVGILFGLLFLWVFKLGLLALGALGGFSLATFILSWKSGSVIDNDTWRPVFMAGMMIVSALICLLFERTMIIVSTSLFGAGAICAGADVFAATGYVQALQYFLNNSESFVISDQMIGLLASFAAIALLGMAVQFKFHRGYSHRPEHPYGK